MALAFLFGHVGGVVAQHLAAGVEVLVDPVPHTHDLLLGVELGGDEGGGPVGRADLVEHVHHSLVGPAVQRPLERADGRNGSRVLVAERAGRGNRREGAGVHAVIDVQNERDVEQLGLLWGGFLTLEHVQEVARMGQVESGRDGRQPQLGAVDGRDQAGHLGDQPHRDVAASSVTGVLGLMVEQCQVRHGASERLHRVHASGIGGDHVQQFLGHGAVGPQLRVEVRQFGGAGQVAV